MDRLVAALAMALATCPAGHPCLALAAVDVFLRLNGQRLRPADGEIAVVFTELAEGRITQQPLLKWLRWPGLTL